MGALLGRLHTLSHAAATGHLRVRPAGDRFEREAHAIADRVAAPTPRGRTGATPPRVSRHPGRAPGGRSLDGDVSRAIEAGRGRGRALPERVRRTLEPKLGVDLRPIRIQTDGRARALTQTIGARAMTVGRTIWFGDGAFSPDTRSGRETLRHEVVHALQQSGIRRGMGRGKARMGTPSAPAVQCLMTSADVKVWGGSPGASIKGKKRYSKILSKLDAWHRSRNTRQKTRLLKEMETLVDAFIKANGGTRDAVKERKLAAVRDLKAQIAHERGDTTERSAFDKVNRAREQVRQTGITGLPDTAVTGTKYIFKMHSHIGHKRYTALAKKRASLTRDETLKFWKKRGDKKSSSDIKREAAKGVADEFTGDWDKKTFTDRERAKAKRDFVDTLIRSSGDVGHAWVSFETESREGTVTDARSFGFWPHYAATHFKDAVPGNVHHPDDRYDGRGNTRSKRHEVSFRNWKRGITTCYDTLRSPPAYQLLGTNCTTFTRDIARATNVTFPNAFWIAPDLSWIWNPNDLYDTFED